MRPCPFLPWWDRATGEPEVFLTGLRLHRTPRNPAPTTRRQSVSSWLPEFCYSLPAKKLFKPRNIAYLVISCAIFVIWATASLGKRPTTIRLQPLDTELSKGSQNTPRDVNPTPPLADGLNKSLSKTLSLKITANGTRRNLLPSKPLVGQSSALSNHEAVTSGAEPPRRVVLLVTNQGFLDFTDNLLQSIKKAGCHPNVTVVAEDKASFRNLSSRQDGPHVIRPTDFKKRPKKQNALDFGVKDYVKLVNRRPKYILDFIQRGLEVFFIDSDSYWFKDPFPYFQGEFDVAYAKDSPYNFNAGVGYYKSAPNTVRFLKFWIQQMTAHAKSRKPQHDQFVLNRILRSKSIRGLRVMGLNKENFSCAKRFSKTQECDNYTSEAAVFHAAYLRGHDAKKTMFEQCKIWLL